MAAQTADLEGSRASRRDEAMIVSSGIVEIVELQQTGWQYLRP